jgi:hypothetical protein
VEIAPIPGASDAFALRDSKNPDAGTLRFTGEELRAAGMSAIQYRHRRLPARPNDTVGELDHFFTLQDVVRRSARCGSERVECQ